MNDAEKQIRLKRLRYRANHRGIKEMDIILGGFANDCLDRVSDKKIDDFELLMAEHDRDLILWFTGEAEFPHEHLLAIFSSIQEHMRTRKFDA